MKDTHSKVDTTIIGSWSQGPKLGQIAGNVPCFTFRQKLYYYNQVYDCNSAALLECQ